MPDLTPDREQFVRDNAVALVADLEAQAARQREELKKLNAAVRAVRAERDRLREALLGIWALADDELTRKGAVPGSFIPQIEADAREALAASGVTVED
jgi:hypothetical protein